MLSFICLFIIITHVITALQIFAHTPLMNAKPTHLHTSTHTTHECKTDSFTHTSTHTTHAHTTHAHPSTHIYTHHSCMHTTHAHTPLMHTYLHTSLMHTHHSCTHTTHAHTPHLHTSTPTHRTLQEARDNACAERDRALAAEREMNSKYDQLVHELVTIMSSSFITTCSHQYMSW